MDRTTAFVLISEPQHCANSFVKVLKESLLSIRKIWGYRVTYMDINYIQDWECPPEDTRSLPTCEPQFFGQHATNVQRLPIDRELVEKIQWCSSRIVLFEESVVVGTRRK